MAPPDDPFTPLDGPTVLRPRPGRGRRGEVPTAHHAAPAPAPSAALPAAWLAPGLNPLVTAATPLLMLIGQVRGTLAMPDVAGLRRHALDRVRRFEAEAAAGGVSSQIVVAARYALCSALDEAAMATPWGEQSEWSQQNLLVTLHGEGWGGEKFFDMLTRISPDPARHIDLMELQYLCLALGFGGRYHNRPGGHAQLVTVQQDLFRAIQTYRNSPRQDPGLSPRWRGVEDRRNPLIRYVPWWVAGSVVLGVLAILFAFYYARLSSAVTPVQVSLQNIGLEAFEAPAPAAPVSGPTLRQRLAREESQQLIDVVEDGQKTVVTPRASDLFASGSATVNPAHEGLLLAVGRAIEQTPGRVLVEGHTDTQPIASGRFTDNFELSRERAVSVSDILRREVSNGGRVSFRGLGETRPRDTGTSAESRARNRRVDIIHVPEP